MLVISIHAPREGSDLLHSSTQNGSQPISIHTPREGSDIAHPAFMALII